MMLRFFSLISTRRICHLLICGRLVGVRCVVAMEQKSGILVFFSSFLRGWLVISLGKLCLSCLSEV